MLGKCYNETKHKQGQTRMDNNEGTQNYQPQSGPQVVQQPEVSPTSQPSFGTQNTSTPLNDNQPTKKNNSKNLVVIIAVAIALVIVSVVMVVLMNDGDGNTSQRNNGKVSQDNPERQSDDNAISMMQRDTQRRDDTSRFISQLNQYQANNGGQVPHTVSTGDEIEAYDSFIDEYMKYGGDTFSDPLTGEDYEVVRFVKCTRADENIEAGKILVYSNAKCFDGIPTFIKGERKVAVTMTLETGGIYCSNN